ncbi:hypothetical protein MKX03_037893 [Papaver bracteatum]|nr:hypothetical protein MKX03_037893 [Papaver bracteatum]
MKGSKDLALTFADKCKNIMASNWRGYLNMVKADAKGSKEDIHTSRIMYFLKSGKPYLCVPREDLHNLNVVIDERGSMEVDNPYPGPLANVLKSIGKLPTRVALTGDVMSLEEDKSLIIPMMLTVKYFHCSSYPHTSLLGFINSYIPNKGSISRAWRVLTYSVPSALLILLSGLSPNPQLKTLVLSIWYDFIQSILDSSYYHCHVMCLLSYLCLLLSYMEYIYIYIYQASLFAGICRSLQMHLELS